MAERESIINPDSKGANALTEVLDQGESERSGQRQVEAQTRSCYVCCVTMCRCNSDSRTCAMMWQQQTIFSQDLSTEADSITYAMRQIYCNIYRIFM